MDSNIGHHILPSKASRLNSALYLFLVDMNAPSAEYEPC